jgi:NADPH:quinone reductase-like Zn-dependent oxidoreductase
VVIGEDASGAGAFGPYDVILDGVGGHVFDSAVPLLKPSGVYVVYGTTAGAEGKFQLNTFFARGGSTIYGFILFHEMLSQPASSRLLRLARMVADGRLHPHIDVEAPWSEVGRVARRLLDRDFPGKAVLHVGG